MNKKSKDNKENGKNKILGAVLLAVAVILAAITAIFTYLVMTYDVAPIGPCDTSVGFSHINDAFADIIGVHMSWYKVTKYLGYICILTCGSFGLYGLIEWIRVKSLFNVDKNILLLGDIYLFTIMLYFAFEVFVVNFRPIIMEGELLPEASFPSSHTVLAIVVMVTGIVFAYDYVEKTLPRTLLQIFFGAVLVASVGGRIIAGEHWLTDIIGGFLYGATILTFYFSFRSFIGGPGKGWKRER